MAVVVSSPPPRPPAIVGPRVIRPVFRGANLKMFQERGPEAILSGPAGTGKSYVCLHKLNALALKYPGCRLLMMRKTLTSLTASGIVTYERKVLDPSFGVVFFGGSAREPAQYRYPNGSVIVVGGMDKPTKVLSAEYDVIYIQECTELTLTDWETLTTRLRNGVIPYQQIIGDCNPDVPTHWIKQREGEQKLAMFESRHEDNPAYYDAETGEWTEVGKLYLSKLENLTGVRYKRLRLGLWVAAEGLIYEGFDPAIHLVDRAKLPKGWEKWPRYWGIDFGFRDPFVWQEWAKGPDGDLYLLRELYLSGKLVQDHAATILAATGRRMEIGSDGLPTGKLIPTRENPDPLPTEVICDHDLEDRKTFERYTGMKTKAAFKAISAGIQAVAERLKLKEGTRKPRIFLVRDCGIEIDGERADAAKTLSTAQEFTSYVWDTSAGRRKGEQPVDDNNHGLDVLRYIVALVDNIRTGRKRTWGAV